MKFYALPKAIRVFAVLALLLSATWSGLMPRLASAQTTNLDSTQDAFVDPINSGTNYDVQQLELTYSNFPAFVATRRAVVQFDVSGVGNDISTAQLVVQVVANNTPAGATVEIGLYGADDGWTEENVTFASAPSEGALLQTVSVASGALDTVTFDAAEVGAYIESQRTGDGVASFVLRLASGSGNLGFGGNLLLEDREGSANGVDGDEPYLVLPAALPPVADAGPDQTVTDADNSGSETVTLDGSGSSDPSGVIESYVWSENGVEIATGVNPDVLFAVGTHVVTLTVTDNDGQTGTDTVTITVEAGVTGEVDLAIEPTQSAVQVGETFAVDIEVRAGTQQVDGAAAYVNFDPALLQVDSVVPGSELTTELRNDFDNAAGEVNVAYGTFSNFPSGTFVLATITFQAIDVSPSTSLTFNAQLPRQSEVTFGGQPTLGDTIPGTVEILNISVTGQVDLEGRSPAPNAAWSIPLTVQFYPAGETTPAYEFTPTTDNTGAFTVQGVEAGTYDIAVKNVHTLQNIVRDVEIVAGQANQVDVGTLREGDSNNDNFVTIVDFSILANTFNLCAGDGGYDERPDFNEDDCVGISDFSLLTNHYDEPGDTIGDVQATAAPTALPAAGGATLRAEATGDATAANAYFDVSLQIEADDQAIDAASAILTFDPGAVRVVEIRPSDQLGTTLLSEYDNDGGSLRYEAGTLGQPFPRGVIGLATVRFQRIAAADSAPVTLSGQSRVYRAGANVLSGFASETLDVEPLGQQLDSHVFLPLTPQQ